MKRHRILLTNDDGIQSPGLWAAAAALADLGHVTVVAPRTQSSGMGRSLPADSDGVIRPEVLTVRGQRWKAYAVGGSPAQAVLHGILEIMPRRPDLVVAGINYGENVATGITISGTVGAAMEAAAQGIPSLAVSLETKTEEHFSNSSEVDFSVPAHFTVLFARLLLEWKMPADVDLLKVDIPSDATPQTPWRITRLSRQRYYESVAPQRASWDELGGIGYREAAILECEHDSDVYVLRVQRQVAVTPLSLDFTARVDFAELESIARGGLDRRS